MKKMLFIGEGMAELRQNEKQGIDLAYAGDTLNAAVYAKRFNKNLSVDYFTAIGGGFLSDGFINLLTKEQIGTDFVFRDTSKEIGIYAIQTDEFGERSFSYWRKGSAATELVSHFKNSPTLINELCEYDEIFFSGITLAILTPEDREILLENLERCRNQGVKIAFDPNYRPALWEGVELARIWMDKAYALSDILMPGLEDHEVLYDHQSVKDIEEYFAPFSYQELIIKAGKQGVFSCNNDGEHWHCAFEAAEKQIDSTAAGDSFAGTYLASRFNGVSIANSVLNASGVAREVVQKLGAIVD